MTPARDAVSGFVPGGGEQVSVRPAVLGDVDALIELYANVRITSWYYTWTAPAWLAWFVYATQGSVKSGDRPTEARPSA